MTTPSPRPSSHRNRQLALSLAALALGMILLAFASVPLYRVFCQITGFGGATQQVAQAPGAVSGSRLITIRFNADTDPALPWDFHPQQQELHVTPGEEALAFYEAYNRSNHPVSGMAVYNVTPHKAGPYFHKIACFCFEQQTLQPKQRVDMPVSFFVDPAILTAPDLQDVTTITLSYQFFPQN